jgi:hypothetical protein
MKRALLMAALAGLAAAPAAGKPRTVAGQWASDRGPLTLHQTDMAVTGRYGAGRLDGQLRGRQLTGVWKQPTSERRCRRALDGAFYWGRVSLTFTGPDQFTGRWSYCDRPTVPGDGVWSGRRAAAGWAPTSY